VQETVSEIQERHSKVAEIEAALLELNQIFLDLTTLVDGQGELLDDIATHVRFPISPGYLFWCLVRFVH